MCGRVVKGLPLNTQPSRIENMIREHDVNDKQLKKATHHYPHYLPDNNLELRDNG